jgi:starch-binding outer membrane protein, SusD/RagB family
MKNISILFIISISFTLFSSCEKMMGDFLDKAPGVDVTEDTIFSSRVQVETFIAGTYRYGLHAILPRSETTYTGSARYNTSSCMTDESEAVNTWVDGQKWNISNVTRSNINSAEDYRWSIRFIALRRTNILLERIDAVNGLDPSYVNQVKGEAKFIRALNYFEMLKRYGGMPIVDKKFELLDDFFRKRNTISEMVDFIISDCDEAISMLPDSYSSDMRGRATKGAALMLKAKTLLFAASPIFNTATPYLNMEDPANNNLICYGNYDVSRWQLAADAARAVIDWAPAGGMALITDLGADKNYRYIFEKPDNSETILANKLSGPQSRGGWPFTGLIPIGTYSGTWGMGNSMTFNFLKKYEKRDGTPQTWDPVGGTDLITKYNELDYRFRQSVAHVGSYWNVDFPIINSYIGGNHNNSNIGGQWIMKFIPQTLTNASNSAMPNDIIFRLGEAYLNYAEALNEAQGPVDDAYTAINIIRTRSGQPELPAGLSQEEFRERVRNERAIELFFEDHRFWDIRRWLIAEEDGVMQGDFYGFKIYPNPTPPNFRYDVYKFETRIFNTALYLHPIMHVEVLKGYLIQNPGH